MNKHSPLTPFNPTTVARFVTNTQRPIFALKALPEVVKGALFSRYSRSNLDLRSLLEREFLAGEETLLEADEKKAHAFYKRVLDGYGDDSVGELGGAHLALEGISMLAANHLQASRIGGSFLEKSTRYVRFDDLFNGDYRFYQDPQIMASPQQGLFLKAVRTLFDSYRDLLGPLQQFLRQASPRPQGQKKIPWERALHAHALDVLRGLLPICTHTNMGLYGNGRFFQSLIAKTRSQSLPEMQALANAMQCELEGVIPAFVTRSAREHPNTKAQQTYHQTLLKARQKTLAQVFPPASVAQAFEGIAENGGECVRLLHCESEGQAVEKMLTAWLYEDQSCPWDGVQRSVADLDAAARQRAIESLGKARKNRRHKPPRATELVFYTFELQADFGAFRDLHRHRTLTQQRQPLGISLGYTIPEDIQAANLEKPFCQAILQAAEAHQQLSQHFSAEQAAYVLPMAYRVRWQVHLNLRALIWLTELRTMPQGHLVYRGIAQQMYQCVLKAHPLFAPLFGFVHKEPEAGKNGTKFGRWHAEKKIPERENQGAFGFVHKEAAQGKMG